MYMGNIIDFSFLATWIGWILWNFFYVAQYKESPAELLSPTNNQIIELHRDWLRNAED